MTLKTSDKIIKLRLSRDEDADEIAACLRAAFEPFRSQYTAGAYRDTVPSPHAICNRIANMKIYAAVSCDGKIIGTLAASAANGEGHLRGMAVHPDWWGHGIADQLLARAESDLLAAGCTRVTLDTTLPLQRAIRFYEKNGYSPTGNVTNFFRMPLHGTPSNCLS